MCTCVKLNRISFLHFIGGGDVEDEDGKEMESGSGIEMDD